MVTMMSLMMGILTTAMTIFTVLYSGGSFSNRAGDFRDISATLVIPATLTVAATGVSVFLMTLWRELRARADVRIQDLEQKGIIKGGKSQDD